MRTLPRFTDVRQVGLGCLRGHRPKWKYSRKPRKQNGETGKTLRIFLLQRLQDFHPSLPSDGFQSFQRKVHSPIRFLFAANLSLVNRSLSAKVKRITGQSYQNLSQLGKRYTLLGTLICRTTKANLKKHNQPHFTIDPTSGVIQMPKTKTRQTWDAFCLSAHSVWMTVRSLTLAWCWNTWTRNGQYTEESVTLSNTYLRVCHTKSIIVRQGMIIQIRPSRQARVLMRAIKRILIWLTAT